MNWLKHRPLYIAGFVLASAALWLLTWAVLVVIKKRHNRKLLSGRLPFPNSESRYETVDGVRLHYTVHGRGHDVILLHGIAANIYCWRELEPILAKRSRVWAVDLMGFGLSDKPRNRGYDLRSQAQLLLKFMDVMGIKSATVVGNSMGGAIASEMALLGGQRIRNLCLLNSAHDTGIFLFKPSHYKLLKRFLSIAVPAASPLITQGIVKRYINVIYGQPVSISDDHVAAYVAPYAAGLDGHYAFVEAVESMLDATLVERLRSDGRVRMLILCGANDKLVPPKFAEQLHKSVPGSHFHRHPEAGHHIQEEVPDWVARHILDFIASDEAGVG